MGKLLKLYKIQVHNRSDDSQRPCSNTTMNHVNLTQEKTSNFSTYERLND